MRFENNSNAFLELEPKEEYLRVSWDPVAIGNRSVDVRILGYRNQWDGPAAQKASAFRNIKFYAYLP